MIEVWKSVVGYEGIYEISNFGNVRSVERVIVYEDGRIYNYPSRNLSFNKTVQGYNSVHLYKNCKRKNKKVHILVAEAFLDNPENLPDVNHIDGQKRNNHVDNLEWSSRYDNMRHAFETGLANNTGTNHGNNVYTEEQILKVKELLNLNIPYSDIETETGVKRGTIYVVKSGKQWKHL